jgi:class 3 adenylate cyclase
VAATPTPPARATVLVVDDDDANRDVLGRRLTRLGYGVIEAADGAAALEVLARESVDLVLLDLMMPVMDGFAVLERRRDDERLGAIPVVMISALDQVEHVARCIELGADDYLTKPFDPVLLKARVGACIEKKQLRDRERQLLMTVTEQSAQLREMNRDLERRVEEKVREVERLSLMQRFVSPELSQALAEGGVELLRSHRREIAVLFCDLRGFTSFAETAEPEDVMQVLGEFHSAVGPLIFAHQGTLTHFTGDGMMVVFNDPIPCDHPAAKAAGLALAMRDSAEDLSAEWRRRGHTLALGVGLAMGFATCGQIGFDGRFEYTAIGTIPNLAARLCEQAAGGQVLANERIRAEIGSQTAFAEPRELTLKGFARPVTAYEVEPFTAARAAEAQSQ